MNKLTLELGSHKAALEEIAKRHPLEIAAAENAAMEKREAVVRIELTQAHKEAIDELAQTHAEEIAAEMQKTGKSHDAALKSVAVKHRSEMEKAEAKHIEKIEEHKKDLEMLAQEHAEEVLKIQTETGLDHASAVAAMAKKHARELSNLEALHQLKHKSHAQLVDRMTEEHADEVERLTAALGGDKEAAVAAMLAKHKSELKKLEGDADRARLEAERVAREMTAAHGDEVDRLTSALGGDRQAAIVAMEEKHKVECAGLAAKHAAAVEAHKDALEAVGIKVSVWRDFKILIFLWILT